MGLFKKKATVENKCNYENSTGDCGLIQKLKDLQSQKKEVDAKIKSYEQNQQVTFSSFFELLVKMEDHDFEMGYDYSRYLGPEGKRSRIKQSFNSFGVNRFELVINQIPNKDIDQIYYELKAIKNKANFLCELQQQSSALGTEIKNIKDILGIE